VTDFWNFSFFLQYFFHTIVNKDRKNKTKVTGEAGKLKGEIQNEKVKVIP